MVKSMSSSGLSIPSHVDTPLVRADVTRLERLAYPPSLEDGGPLTVNYRIAKDAFHTSLPLCARSVVLVHRGGILLTPEQIPYA